MCGASLGHQGSNFESCVWRAVSSHSSHHPQDVLAAQFSLYVHKGGLKLHLFYFIRPCIYVALGTYQSSLIVSEHLFVISKHVKLSKLNKYGLYYCC